MSLAELAKNRIPRGHHHHHHYEPDPGSGETRWAHSERYHQAPSHYNKRVYGVAGGEQGEGGEGQKPASPKQKIIATTTWVPREAQS